MIPFIGHSGKGKTRERPQSVSMRGESRGGVDCKDTRELCGLMGIFFGLIAIVFTYICKTRNTRKDEV